MCLFIQIKRSQALFDAISKTLSMSLNSVKTQYKVVRDALAKRQAEVLAAKTTHEQNLTATLAEIREQSDNIERLRAAYEAKRNPIQLNSTRLDNRFQRPQIELVADAVHTSLLSEMEDLETAASRIRDQHGQAESVLHALQQAQRTLNEQIATKTFTLELEANCIAFRDLYSDRVPAKTDFGVSRSQAEWVSFGSGRTMQYQHAQ